MKCKECNKEINNVDAIINISTFCNCKQWDNEIDKVFSEDYHKIREK